MESASFPGFPVTLRLSGRLCVVVGGGTVALRKVKKLLQAGAQVRVVAQQLHSELATLAGVEIINAAFRSEHLNHAFLVFAATNDRAVNAAVTAAAQNNGSLINVADSNNEGDLQLPAVLNRGNLSIAIASDGASPALAVWLRDKLSRRFGPEWATVGEIVAALRRKQLTVDEGTAYNSTVVCKLLDEDLPGIVAAGDEAAINRLLNRIAGDGITLAALGVRLGKGTT